MNLRNMISARVTEPSIGSYRLDVRLTEPLQPDLFEKPRVDALAVSDAVFGFLECLTARKSGKLEEFVPQRDYRKAFLRLTQSFAPSGRRLTEIGLYRRRDDQTQSIYLTDWVPAAIRESLAAPTAAAEIRQEYRGVLRALHLDKNWLELVTKSQGVLKCDTVPDMLDDVVGPMVNHEVIVRGPLRTRYRKEKLLAEEVELVDEV